MLAVLSVSLPKAAKTIRYKGVPRAPTCVLAICWTLNARWSAAAALIVKVLLVAPVGTPTPLASSEIGRASSRERVLVKVAAAAVALNVVVLPEANGPGLPT